MKKDRVGAQVWPSSFPAPFLPTGLLKGTIPSIAVRDRNVVIAFAETSK